MHEGHRQRIRQRLESDEGDLQDHEVLEILLFNAIPRKNTNNTAHALIDAFGSIRGVLQATTEQLKSVNGIGEEAASYLRCIGLIYERADREENVIPVKFNRQSFSDYLQKSFSALNSEVLEVFCLDGSERVTSSRRFTSDSHNSVQVRAEVLNRYIATVSPKGIVVAHNHPDCTCRPSEEDEDFTAQIMMVCSMSNVRFYDHIIVGKDGVYSYFGMGRMEDIRRKYNINRILGGGTQS